MRRFHTPARFRSGRPTSSVQRPRIVRVSESFSEQGLERAGSVHLKFLSVEAKRFGGYALVKHVVLSLFIIPMFARPRRRSRPGRYRHAGFSLIDL